MSAREPKASNKMKATMKRNIGTYEPSRPGAGLDPLRQRVVCGLRRGPGAPPARPKGPPAAAPPGGRGRPLRELTGPARPRRAFWAWVCGIPRERRWEPSRRLPWTWKHGRVVEVVVGLRRVFLEWAQRTAAVPPAALRVDAAGSSAVLSTTKARFPGGARIWTCRNGRRISRAGRLRRSTGTMGRTPYFCRRRPEERDGQHGYRAAWLCSALCENWRALVVRNPQNEVLGNRRQSHVRPAARPRDSRPGPGFRGSAWWRGSSRRPRCASTRRATGSSLMSPPRTSTTSRGFQWGRR